MKDSPKKLNKREILDALKEDMRAADTLRLEMKTKVDSWKAQYDGEPYGNEQKGKSSLVSRDIKRQDEWQHATIKDAFVSDQDVIKCSPITYEDVESAKQNELVLNCQFTRQFNRYKFITDVVKLLFKEGSVVAKTSWVYEDEEYTESVKMFSLDQFTGKPVVAGIREVNSTRVLENRPHAEVCRLEDIYIDPTCMGDLSKAGFVIHRYETDLSTLRSAKKYKNLEAVAKQHSSTDENDYQEHDESEFTFKDAPRKKLIAYEYWGNYDINNDGIAEPIVCTWIGDVIIQLEDNPFPGQEIPFEICSINSATFDIYGEAQVELIGDNQKISTAIKRGIMDNMANSNNAQKGIKIGSLDVINRKRFLSGKNFEFNGSMNDFYEGSYNQIPQSVFSVLEMVNNETDSLSGVKAFTGGINGGSLGGTATAARGALDAVSIRKLDIVRNIAENLIKPIMRKWMAYNSEFLREEEVIRITNDEFVDIRRDDLKGQIDIEISVSTAEDNAAKADNLAFLLQTLGPNLPQEISMMLMSKMARLHRMPDLQHALENFQPQPDPYTEQMKMLEMEKLKAEIQERISRATENATDVRAKNAQASLNEAKAANLNSDTDLKDQQFIHEADGTNFNKKMAEKDHDRETVRMQHDQDNKSKEDIQLANLLNNRMSH